MNHIKQHTLQLIAIAAVTTLLSGCVVDNYNFAKVRTESLGARTERLAKEIVQQHDKDGDDSLYDSVDGVGHSISPVRSESI